MQLSIESILKNAMKIPGVAVDRESFLKNNFSKYGNIEKLSSSSTVMLYSADILNEVAKSVISRHVAEVTSISAASGLPGGLWAIPAAGADIAQFYSQLLIVAQKLAYIYGMPDLQNEEGDFDEEAYKILIILIGTGAGVEGASQILNKIATNAIKNSGKEVGKRIAEKSVEKKAIDTIVTKILKALGKKASQKEVQKVFGKFIPVVSALISGAFTYASFKPMTKKLHSQLKKNCR